MVGGSFRLCNVQGMLLKSYGDGFVVGRVPSRGEFLRKSEDTRWGQRADIDRFAFRQHAL